MPHCIIEVTKNLTKRVNYNMLMNSVANAINTDELFNGDDIKVRIYEIEHSYMGTVDQEFSYVATEIALVDNKTEEQLSNIVNEVQNVLNNFFRKKIGKNSITTRVSFINPKFFGKDVNY